MSLRIVIPEDQLEEKFAQACNILMKLRHHKKRFELSHDAATKVTMKDWEDRADIFLESLTTETDPNFLTPEKSNEPGN